MPSPLVERAVIDAIDNNNALLKFISPNDTGLTGAHQCGYYLPKAAWRAFVPYAPSRGRNAEHRVEVLWQDGRRTESCIKWYGIGTRSEYRLTRFGRDFPFLTTDNVGDLLVLIRTGEASFNAYVFDLPEHIADIQASLGVEIIGTWGLYESLGQPPETEDDCIHRRFAAFVEPLRGFPDTATFSAVTREAIIACMSVFARQTPDYRLMLLMDREYALFRMAERLLCQDEICRRFLSVDDFLSTAARMMNRRKSRAGRALENHVGYLLHDAHIPFDARASVDGEPDVLIPGKIQYEDPNWPDENLFVVGVKTTCKDRWRQVLNEARRVHRKHIMTVQQGISAKQLVEMRDSGVSLVVPQKLHSMYPTVERMEILTLRQFFEKIRHTLAITL
jgi:type II restriction enzyme